MGVLESLDVFCHPVSNFWVSTINKKTRGFDELNCSLLICYASPSFLSCLQWRDGLTYCSFKDLCTINTTLPSNATHCSCHDEVDLSVCFEDSAVLYGIFILFWFLAGLEFLLGRSNIKPKINFNLLHAAKLVRRTLH